MVLGLLAGIAGGALGGFFKGKSAKRQQAFQQQNTQQGLGFFDQTEAQQGLFGSLAQNQLQANLASTEEAFGSSREELSRLGQGQRERVVQRERELAADLQQQAVQSGFEKTGERRSLKRDTDVALSNIDAQLSRMFIDLNIGEAQAKSGARKDLATLFGRRSNQASQLGTQRAALVTGQQFVPGQNVGENIFAGGLGGLFGGLSTFGQGG